MNQSGWLVGPWYDALLIANVAWPLLLCWQIDDDFSGRAGLQFWQVYFLTIPHRWITLGLVFLDREQFGRRSRVFLLIAAAVALFCVGIRLTTGALTCLLTIDYIWNAWHFASQHHGIYRIYTRRRAETEAGGAHGVVGFSAEKWGMRLFLLYVILRVAAATWPYPQIEQVMLVADWVALAVPAWLVVRQLVAMSRTAGGTIYLVSVCVLYVGLLGAVHFNQPGLTLSLATASAVFHATEYLALVSWSVRGKSSSAVEKQGIWGYFLPRWGLALAMFMLVLGSAGWLLERELLEPWLLVNVIVAFLHYAYDGLIWRRR